MANLSTTYMGLQLKNPIIAASSGLTDSVPNIKELADNGASAIVLKSLFEEEIVAEMETSLQKMTSSGFIYPETFEYYEQTDDEEVSSKYLKLISDAKKAVDIPIIASINCVTAGEWTHFPKLIEQAGADALELNLFILPSDFTRDQIANEKIYYDIIQEVTQKISIPVALKISSHFSDLGRTLQNFSTKGIGGLVLFNRFYNPDFDLDSLEIIAGNILSNPSDISMSLRWISIMANRVDCDLSATTGIHNGESVIKQILAGANTVQIASAIYKNGFEYIQAMLEEIEMWMDSKNYNSLDEFRGKLSQSKSNNPAAYERVQFMKHFRSYQK